MSEPFLKWAGGKRWLTRGFDWLFPDRYGRYIEPFLGGGSVFFAQEPDSAILSDANRSLIATYQAVKSDWSAVMQHLWSYADRHSDTFYYEARRTPGINEAAEAARFIYLNRTCWNGLYRVNRKGEFNVPRGTKNSVVMDADDFEGVARVLGRATLYVRDFEPTIAAAGSGDFVFLDPPYAVYNQKVGFLRYNEKVFSWRDQERLLESAISAANRGAKVLLLNALHPSIEGLYAGIGRHHIVDRNSVISGDANYRKGVRELAIQIGFETRNTRVVNQSISGS
jgi:DNA adenine methylase